MSRDPRQPHDPQVYRSRLGAWVVCACGWASGTHVSQQQAQMAWSAHVRAMLLPPREDPPTWAGNVGAEAPGSERHTERHPGAE